MDASERLAALLAGELDADERDALEAELARDPELRADLAAMERADRHLAELAPPVPPAGFEQRLDDRVAATLAELLGEGVDGGGDLPRAGSTGRPSGEDVFTARRRDRASRRMQTMIGVAAAAVVLVGSGVLFTSFSSDDADDRGDSSAVFETMETDDRASDDAGSAESDGFVTDGPVVVAEERTLDDDDLDELLAGGELAQVSSQDLEIDVGRDVAGMYRSDLGARSVAEDSAAGDMAVPESEAGDDTQALDEAAPRDDADEDSDEERDGSGEPDGGTLAAPEVLTRDGVPLPASDAADIARCLDEVLGSDPDAIPAYAELASYQGVEVVLLGLVTLDPGTDSFARNELWMLDRDTCQLLRFAQD